MPQGDSIDANQAEGNLYSPAIRVAFQTSAKTGRVGWHANERSGIWLDEEAR